MSRRKQAKPIRHLDDLDDDEAAPNCDKQESLASLSEDDDNEDFTRCVHCELKFSSDQELAEHQLICANTNVCQSRPEGSRANQVVTAGEKHCEDRVNNNSENRRRKRDESDGADDEHDNVEHNYNSDASADENDSEAIRSSLPKKQARDEHILGGSETATSAADLGSMLNPLLPPGLLPYAATIANANVTLDALQNTKMALAQYAATAMNKNGQHSPSALQELAVVQSTLYALQQQQLIQLQLLQQLQQQLHISQAEGHTPGTENLLSMFGYVPSINQERASSSNSTRSPTPGLEPCPSLKEPVARTVSLEEQRQEIQNHISSPVEENIEKEDEFRNLPDVPDPLKQLNSAFSGSFVPGNSSSAAPYSSVLSQLPGGSLADMILQTPDPLPNPDGPSTLEMLQRTAQQVLNNASQGLLATNLADELGLRSNGGVTGDGKKDQMFKHRCRYCGKVFSSDSALQIHIRSHTGERPFKCNICGNRFTTKGNLKVHFQRHAARFPHVKMNPHPVPEHLDKFYPPLLAQMDIDESKLSPPNPAVPFSQATVSPGSQILRPTAMSLPSCLSSPFSRPVAGGSDHQQQASRANAKHLPLASLLKESSLVAVTQESPQDLTKVASSQSDNACQDQEPGNRSTPMEFTVKSEVDDEELQPMTTSPSISNADLNVAEKTENFTSSRNFPQDESTDDSHYDSHDYTVSENMHPTIDMNKDSNLEAPEDLSGRRSSTSSSSSPSSTVNPASLASGLPFNPMSFSPSVGPQLRFSLPFPMAGPLGPFPGGVVMREPSPTGPGITFQTPAGPIMLPPDIDPAKDPAIYTNLLPRPGSNDNSWESLIEITKTSETSKLQQLVDNIENKLVDPNQCVVCHRVLSCKSALQMHYRTHTGERPFKCKICSRAFTTKGNLKTHMGVHRAKPPARMLHMCPVCHKKFTNGFVLQQHIRLHTGEPTDLTPEQIQAAEVRDFPAPFPGFMGGFHPFLPHGAPFPPMAMGAHPFNVGAAGGGNRPFAFHFRQEAINKEGQEVHEGQDADINTEGSSSGALSPGSSSTSSHLVTAKNGPANEEKACSADRDKSAKKRRDSQGNDEVDKQPSSPNNSEYEDCKFRFSRKGLNEDDSQSSRSPSPEKNKTVFVEAAPSANDVSNHQKTSNELPKPEPHSERFYNWLTAQSSFLERPLALSKSESDTNKQSTPLPTLSSRNASFFPAAYNILPPGSVSPSAAANSALSSLTSAVMTPPSFNPLNLPISAPGRGNTTCNICFKTFACHSALEIHYRSHTKERPFKCNICDRGFSTKGNMKQHMMTHKNRDGTPVLLNERSERSRSRSRDSCLSERESLITKRDLPPFKVHNKEMESNEDSSMGSTSSKEHCLSLTIQHSTQVALAKTAQEQAQQQQQQQTNGHEYKRVASPGSSTLRKTSVSHGNLEEESFLPGYEARLSAGIGALVRPPGTDSPFPGHGSSAPRGALPVPPGPVP